MATKAESLQKQVDELRMELAWLKAHFYVEDHDGGWTAVYKSYTIPAWDDTPYSRERGKGFHHKSLDEAIQAEMKRQGYV